MGKKKKKESRVRTQKTSLSESTSISPISPTGFFWNLIKAKMGYRKFLNLFFLN